MISTKQRSGKKSSARSWAVSFWMKLVPRSVGSLPHHWPIPMCIEAYGARFCGAFPSRSTTELSRRSYRSLR
jgi:hypothetical protein